jgi:hypothetical protein
VLLLASACVAGNGSAIAPPPAEDLVREDARPTIVRRGDLDGDGGVELVVASASRDPGAFGLPTPYLEVFAAEGEDWRRVFDASGHAPPGAGAPGPMLAPQDQELAVGQAIEVLELADLAKDGAPELVAAIANVGATSGPLELWILSMGSDGLRTDYYMRTDRGGKVAVADKRVLIEFGVYRKGDPGCCPSSFEVRTIGYDSEADAIGVLDRERTRLDTP